MLNRVLVKNLPYHFCTFGVYVYLSVFYIVADHTASENNTLFHSAFLSPFNTLGSLTAFFLCDRSHNRKAKFSIRVKGEKVVVCKHNADAVFLELTGVINAVECVTGKTADFLCYNQVIFLKLGIHHHAVECFTLFCACTRYTFINVNIEQFPHGISFDIFFEIILLACQ